MGVGKEEERKERLLQRKGEAWAEPLRLKGAKEGWDTERNPGCRESEHKME